jgi:hypothetical protein
MSSARDLLFPGLLNMGFVLKDSTYPTLNRSVTPHAAAWRAIEEMKHKGIICGHLYDGVSMERVAKIAAFKDAAADPDPIRAALFFISIKQQEILQTSVAELKEYMVTNPQIPIYIILVSKNVDNMPEMDCLDEFKQSVQGIKFVAAKNEEQLNDIVAETIYNIAVQYVKAPLSQTQIEALERLQIRIEQHVYHFNDPYTGKTYGLIDKVHPKPTADDTVYTPEIISRIVSVGKYVPKTADADFIPYYGCITKKEANLFLLRKGAGSSILRYSTDVNDFVFNHYKGGINVLSADNVFRAGVRNILTALSNQPGNVREFDPRIYFDRTGANLTKEQLNYVTSLLMKLYPDCIIRIKSTPNPNSLFTPAAAAAATNPAPEEPPLSPPTSEIRRWGK